MIGGSPNFDWSPGKTITGGYDNEYTTVETTD